MCIFRKAQANVLYNFSLQAVVGPAAFWPGRERFAEFRE